MKYIFHKNHDTKCNNFKWRYSALLPYLFQSLPQASHHLQLRLFDYIISLCKLETDNLIIFAHNFDGLKILWNYFSEYILNDQIELYEKDNNINNQINIKSRTSSEKDTMLDIFMNDDNKNNIKDIDYKNPFTNYIQNRSNMLKEQKEKDFIQ